MHIKANNWKNEEVMIMPFSTYSIERDFVTVVEVLLDNYNCGYTFIRKGEYISGDTLKIHYEKCRNIIQGSLDNELLEINNSGKCNTFIGIAPMGIMRHEGGTRSELTYLDTVLSALSKNGRLILLVPSNFLTAPYTEGVRTYILNRYCINNIIQLPNSNSGIINGAYVLDIENSSPKNKVPYYSKTAYGTILDICSAIKAEKPAFEVSIDMLSKRWDAQYLDPNFDDIRKKYLAKDTVRLGDLAKIIPGANIRSEEYSEDGEYLVLSPRLISEGKIDYQDDRAYYTGGRPDDRRFSRAILEEGDIVVCVSGRISFFVYHEAEQRVVANQLFCVIRSEEDKQRNLQLYFGTQLGEESFNLQAQMLSVGGTHAHLTPRNLASFVIPNIKTLETAARIQESNNLINKISMLFESEGWEVIKEYRPNSDHRLEFDIALKTRGKVVGVVEAKRNKALNADVKRRIKDSAERALRIGNIQFFILFINDAMYRYKDNEFFRIPEIPTPATYKQYDKQEEFYVDNADDSDVKEMPEGTAPISDAYLILSAISDLGQMLGKKIDAVQKTVDTISAQIQELSGRISIYQDLVEKQLEYAKDNLEEQERILKAFTDTCVERVTKNIKAEYAIELYSDEKKKLIESMGELAWNKLDEDTQNFLVSSKVMYAKLIGISDIVDYSGVCLLVTKSLELELGKRFCQNYIAYYQTAHPGTSGLTAAPSTIKKKRSGQLNYLSPDEFMLGSFQYVVGKTFSQNTKASEELNIKNGILEYVKQSILKTYATTHSDTEILQLLSDYADDIEKVRVDYRNKSAHTNAITKVSAKECFDFVLDVEKILKKMLDSFDS